MCSLFQSRSIIVITNGTLEWDDVKKELLLLTLLILIHLFSSLIVCVRLTTNLFLGLILTCNLRLANCECIIQLCKYIHTHTLYIQLYI